MQRSQPTLILCLLLLGVCSALDAATTNSFKNFETAPVHPIAISPDGSTLAVCNLPDGRVEIFSLENAVPQLRASIPVGIDPVTVRFRGNNELWVVNHISDSIIILEVQRLAIRTLIATRDGPADVVFAGNPVRAFVSCPPENLIQVIDPENFSVLRTIPIKAERPKALAVSPDGLKVYAAIFESGNGTTLVAPRLIGLDQPPPAGPADLDFGPHAGQNPAPNFGTNFVPAFGTNLPASNAPPRVSLIVKKQPNGRWLDDNHGDWTSFVSGTNAPFSGRVPGWDLLDRDIAVIDATTFEVSFVDGLMNICMDLAVNPGSGEIAMVGTDALNHSRFEPVLQSVFTRVLLALVQSTNSAAQVLDLNPHLDYDARTIPLSERQKSLGDPRAVLWNSSGTRLYVTGMGSDNLTVLDPTGNRQALVKLPAGPTGMALDEPRERIYIFNRFASSLSVLHTETLSILTNIPIYDPTPPQIKEGRPHLYATHKTSGLGQAACASCHIDARMDRLAWDLGSQLGSMKFIDATNRNFGSVPPAVTNHFHPMKGPMITQTLQDIIGHEPFHWRGDRDGLEEFNPTFKDLQGADDELTDEEMQQFEDFLATIHFPPNRLRQFDNSLSRSVRLEGHLSLGRGKLRKDAQLPAGDAVAGMNIFRGATCVPCHSLPSGMGPDQVFRNNRWTKIPTGPKGEHHVALIATARSHELPFKIPHLRNLSEKIGLNLDGASQSGFGFFHDGRVDTLTRFLQDGFFLQDDKQTADMIAFLLSISGSDLPAAAAPTNGSLAPGDFSRDVPAAVGRQLLLSADSNTLDAFISRASSPTGRVDLIVKGCHDGVLRGWLFQTNRFRRDGPGQTLARSALLALASPTNKFLFTLVPAGSGYRLALDRDEDGQLDFDEAIFRLAVGTQQRDSLPLIIRAQTGQRLRVQLKNSLRETLWTVLPETEHVTSSETSTNFVPILEAQHQRYYRLELLP
jgi:DNA-binding beta-propeller fold protein YncE